MCRSSRRRYRRSKKAVSIAPDEISWVQTGYLIAEVVAIPLTGFLTRLLGMRWLFSGGNPDIFVGLSWMRSEHRLHRTDYLANPSGPLRRHTHPRRFRICLSALSCSAAGHRNHNCRLTGRPCPDRWANRRWMDHRHLFLALALHDQCRAGLMVAILGLCMASA